MATASRNEAATGVYDVLIVNDTLVIPNGSLVNKMIAAAAGIDASKLEAWLKGLYAQVGAAVTATAVLGIIRGTSGTSIGVEVTNASACAGSTTVTVDVQKNGVSILSAPITLNSSSSTSVPIAGNISVSSLADGDIITAVITLNQSGTDAEATGVAVQWDYNEDHPNG